MKSTIDNARAFRDALGRFPTGVTVVTARDENDSPIGMTANSFSSVSLDPMLVLWSIAKTASAFDAFHSAQHFAIHILNLNQRDISQKFAAKDGDRFIGIETEVGHAGVPLLCDYAARFECETESLYEGGDHIIVLGKVTEFKQNDIAPLAFHAGRYVELVEA